MHIHIVCVIVISQVDPESGKAESQWKKGQGNPTKELAWQYGNWPAQHTSVCHLETRKSISVTGQLTRYE